MNSQCRHIMTGGCQCGAYALTGKPFCYFHSRLHRDARKPVSLIDSIDIPFLEDRCAVQLVITRVLRALVSMAIDRQTASTLLYGLQLALQGVAHDHYDVRFNCVKALSHTRDGDEIAADPDHPGLEEDEDEYEENDEDENDENEEDTGSDPPAEDPGESGAENGPDNGDENEEDDRPSTEKLIADRKYLQSVNHALGANNMQQLEQILRAGPAMFLAPSPPGNL